MRMNIDKMLLYPLHHGHLILSLVEKIVVGDCTSISDSVSNIWTAQEYQQHQSQTPISKALAAKAAKPKCAHSPFWSSLSPVQKYLQCTG